MKKTLLSITILLAATISYAQTPTLEWVKQIGGKLNDRAIPMAVDVTGNVYVAGYFSDTADVDPGVNELEFISAGQNDIYIAKLNPAGDLIWAKHIGGKDNEQVNSLAVDLSGNLYFSGAFSDTVDFDPGANVTKLMSAGGLDAFVAKLDASGGFAWAQRIGGAIADACNAVTISSVGSVYMTGSFQGTTNFNGGSGIPNLTSFGDKDIYVAKLDGSGNFTWFRQMGGTAADAGQSIAADKDDNVLTTGSFINSADFNPGANDTILTSAGSNDIFISKLDAAGNYVWAKRFGELNTDVGISMAVDAAGNVYSTGYFGGGVDFDPNGGVYNLVSSGNFDAYISKLDAKGQFIWARKLGGDNAERGASIAVDAAGNVFSTGTFNGWADFDPGVTTNYNITPAGLTDVYISKLDMSGNFVWATSVGGKSDDYGTSIAVDNNKHIYTTGFFSGKSAFNPALPGADSLASFGSYDAFITKMNDVELTSSAIDELVSAGQVQVYPNPATNVVHVMVKDGANGQAAITDMQGKVVSVNAITGAETTISIQNLANGVYLLKVDTDQQHTVEKIVVVK